MLQAAKSILWCFCLCTVSVSLGTLDVIGIGTVYLLYLVFGLYILGNTGFGKYTNSEVTLKKIIFRVINATKKYAGMKKVLYRW